MVTSSREYNKLAARKWRRENPEKLAEMSKRYYEENKPAKIAKIKEWKKKHRAEMRRRISEFKDKPCIDCGRYYPPYVMHFHHLENNKDFAISSKGLDMSWERVEREISKCIVVCSNCHAIRHWGAVD